MNIIGTNNWIVIPDDAGLINDPVFIDDKTTVITNYDSIKTLKSLAKNIGNYANFSTMVIGDFPALPASGIIIKDKFYAYAGKVVQCVQEHQRTGFTPEQTPALFSFYRAPATGMLWIENERVILNAERTYLGVNYKCLQPHQTQLGWEPNKTPALWVVVVVVTPGVWSGAGVAYKVNDIVTYLTKIYKCLQAHTSQAGWNPVVVPALWQLQ